MYCKPKYCSSVAQVCKIEISDHTFQEKGVNSRRFGFKYHTARKNNE